MTKAFLLLGGNLGDRDATFAQARNQIGTIAEIKAISHMYETEPWGNKNQPSFYNQVLVVDSPISAGALLKALLAIEQAIGRVPAEKWGPRLIDIDLLFYGDEVVDSPDLRLPHPLIPKRNFVLIPLLEVAPTLIHPVEKKTIEELYLDCRDELEVVILEDGL